MSHQQVHVIYSGQVQGVGFRYTTSRIAAGHAVVGFVKNLTDGTVELVAVPPWKRGRPPATIAASKSATDGLVVVPGAKIGLGPTSRRREGWGSVVRLFTTPSSRRLPR